MPACLLSLLSSPQQHFCKRGSLEGYGVYFHCYVLLKKFLIPKPIVLQHSRSEIKVADLAHLVVEKPLG
jgi:hypothetical protein